MQDVAAPEGKQASKSRRCPSSGSANGRSPVNGDSSPPSSSPQIVVNSKHDVQVIAQHLASQPTLPVPRPDAWGVLTPISEKAKTRPQASHIFLYKNEHVLGRVVKDSSCQFDSINVSARHCTIFRKKFKAGEACIPLQGTEPISGDRWLVYIKDSSSNGTFINWQKLKKDSPEARIKDGDIISLVNAPEHENAFAFLYQEIKPNFQTLLTHQINGAATNTLKRKNANDGENIGDCISGDSKRVKGLGIGGPDGPVSLDDVRRLQRSNEDLRNQLEVHVLTIEKLRAESRAATARHDAEIKELKETLSVAFLGQIQDLRLDIGKKDKEIDDYASLCAQQQSKLEDLNHSLVAAHQSRKDADEVIQSQNLNIVELKEQLEDERSQRRNDREKAEADLKAAVDRARSEASEELKRQSETAACQQKEQMEMIYKLQEADKENCVLVEALRLKLEDSRENLVKAERTSRSLELQLHDEELSLAVARKKIVEKEEELQRCFKDLQEEKDAREVTLGKLSSLEVEMESAIQDLSLEKQRLQGARERIMLRETQLRAFHSTAEEIAGLQQKQQEQLQAMMRVLEDGDDENMDCENLGTRVMPVVKEEGSTYIEGAAQQDGLEKRDFSNAERTAGGGKSGGSDAGSQSTANDCTDDVVLHTAVEEWGDGDTQVDDSAGLGDVPKDVQMTTLQNTRKESEPSMPMGTEGGYTQLLETENTTVGKLITLKYPNGPENQVSGRDDAALLQTTRVYTKVYHQNEEEITVKAMDDEAGGLGGETMQLEDEDGQETQQWERRQSQAENLQKAVKSNEKEHEGKPAWPPEKLGHVTHVGKGSYSVQYSRPQDQPDLLSRRDAPLTTLDLLTSEVAGSWAMSTPASVHCENDGSSESEDREEGNEKVTPAARVDFAASQVGNCGTNVTRTHLHPPRGENVTTTSAASQSSLSPRTIAWNNQERRDLNTMLDIVAPDFSRLHGLDRVMQTAPDSEDHSEEDDDRDDETDGGSAESESP